MQVQQARIDRQKANSQQAHCQLCATRGACIVSCVGSEARERLYEVILERPFQKSDALQVQGEVAQSIAIVKLGTVMGTRHGGDSVDRPVALFGRGQLMGAYGLLGQPNQLGAHALSAGRLCEISISDLYRLGVMDRQFLGSLYATINASLGRLADWSRLMRVKGGPQQLLLALQLIAGEQDHRMIRLPSHVALAALLSTTRESVARGLRQLEEKGLIERPDCWHCQLTGALAPPLAPSLPPVSPA